MRGRHPDDDVILTIEEKKILEKMVGTKKSEARMVQRAKIILLASENKYRNTEIGLMVGCGRDNVRVWKKRFNNHRIAGLQDKERCGRPPTFTAHQRAEILALATKSPENEGKHFTDWSTRELAKHATEKNIVKSIHWTTVAGWLRNADIKPHKWEYWLNSDDPNFKKR